MENSGVETRTPENDTKSLLVEKLISDSRLPVEYDWVNSYFRLNWRNLRDTPHAFHATRLSNLAGIVASGRLIGFPEKDAKKGFVFATPIPTRAVEHVYRGGQGDSFERDIPWEERLRRTEEKNKIDPVVLLDLDYSTAIRNGKMNERRGIVKPNPLTILSKSTHEKFIKGRLTRSFDEEVDAMKDGTFLGNIGVVIGSNFPVEYTRVLIPTSNGVESISISDYLESIAATGR